VICLRILPNNQRNFKMAQVTEKLIAPCRCAFRPRRKVTGFPRAGKTKAHGQNGYLLRVVKDFARHSHPLTQTISAGIIERHAGFMNFSSWRLACNQHPSLRVYL
jgi:hypothetical protein